MDTSISTSFDPIRYVLKGQSIAADDLSPQDWRYILEDVIARLKPVVQHMEGFRIISSPIDIWTSHYWLEEKHVQFANPPSSEFARKMRKIADINFRQPLAPMEYEWRSVLIDRNGDWILARYMRNSKNPNAYWRYIDDSEMLAMLHDYWHLTGQIGYAILEGLAEMVRTTIEEREHRLDSLRNREEWLTDVLSRLSKS